MGTPFSKKHTALDRDISCADPSCRMNDCINVCVVSGFRRGVRASIFWNVTQRRLVVSYRRFGTTYCSHLQLLDP